MASTINELIRKTLSLQKTLKQLVKDFSEDGLPADERIFNRILTNDWRLPADQQSCHEERYLRAVNWVNEFRDYIRQLREYCLHERGARESLSMLPLNGNQRASASECLRLLPLQHQILMRWSNVEGERTRRPKSDEDSKLHAELESLVAKNGTKAVAAGIGCTRDTLEDFLASKTRPQGKTRKKMKECVRANKASL
jgi:hypothetical protein